MAETASEPAVEILQEILVKTEENVEDSEPPKKKAKSDVSSKLSGYNLEERLNGILCCAVCLDLPSVSVFQV